ncbi:MAG: hypothetical protein AB1714_14070 [Acidobacteriota bacterium]
MTRLYRQAITDLSRCRGLVLTFYMLGLVPAVLLVLPFLTKITEVLGPSLASARLLHQADPLLIYDLLQQHADFMSLFQWQLCVVVATGCFLRLVLTGGVLDHLASPGPLDLGRLFASSLRVLPGMLWLGVFELAALGGIALLLDLHISITAIQDAPTEWPAFWLGLTKVAMLGAALAAVLQIFKYSRILLFRSGGAGAHAAIVALADGARFFFRNPGGAIGISLYALGLVALAVIMRATLTYAAVQLDLLPVAVGVLSTQVLVFFHQYIRFLNLAASMQFAASAAGSVETPEKTTTAEGVDAVLDAPGSGEISEEVGEV